MGSEMCIRDRPPGDLLQPVGRDAFRARLSAGRHGEVLGMSALPGEPPVDLRLCPAQTLALIHI